MAQESVAATPEEWAALAAYVRGRRHALGITHNEAKPPSGSIWSILENAAQPSGKMSIRALVQVAGWLQLSPPLALIEILHGQDPRKFEPSTDRSEVQDLRATIDRILARVSELEAKMPDGPGELPA